MSEDNKKFGGYEPKIFTQPINKDFICSICNLFVRHPKECSFCGTLYCSSCLSQWEEKNKNNIYECPMRCKKQSKGESIMRPVSRVIRNIINALEVKCPNEDCAKVMTFEEYEKHESICHLPKCQNEKCKQVLKNPVIYKDQDENEHKFCSDMCKYSYIFQEKVKVLTKDELCDWFHEFMTVTLNTDFHKICEKRINNLKNMIRGVSGNNDLEIDDIDYDPGISKFKWDTKRKGQGIKVYNNGDSIFLNETCYAFRSIVANEPFMEGIHYFEIIADKRTESELKIGFTKNPDFNYDTSFSDYPFGWAFYGVGQLRHDNNAGGENYGKKFKKYGTLGVFLDMNKGIMSFSLDKEYFGVAYQSEDLKTGPIYPAVSLLHVGGCTLQCGIPAKPYFFGDN